MMTGVSGRLSIKARPKTKPAAPVKLQIVDLLRSFSILSVMAAHFVYVPPPDPAYGWWWYHFQKNGAYGVGVFFVVSGFLITRLIDGQGKGLFSPSFKTFYARRVARIFPLFFLTILLGLAAAYLLPRAMPRFNYCFLADPGQFNFLFWSSLFTFSFNWYCALSAGKLIAVAWGVMWSLSVEEQFYIFYPLLLKRLGRAGPYLAFLSAMVVLGPLWRFAMGRLSPSYSEWGKFGSFGSFDQIAFGALLYFVAKKYGPFLGLRPRLCALACLSGVALLALAYLGTDTYDHRSEDVVGASCVALGSFLLLLGGLHLRFFQSAFWAPLAWPGKYSYGIYLLHIFVFYFSYPLLIAHGDLLTAYVLFVLISTGVAALCYHFFEAPANLAVRRAFGLKAA